MNSKIIIWLLRITVNKNVIITSVGAVSSNNIILRNAPLIKNICKNIMISQASDHCTKAFCFVALVFYFILFYINYYPM